METFGKRFFSSKTVACPSGLFLAEFSVTEGKKPTPFISLVNPGLESPGELAPKKKNPLHNNTFAHFQSVLLIPAFAYSQESAKSVELPWSDPPI